MHKLLPLIPVIIFLVSMIAIGLVVQRRATKARTTNYAKDYYIGGRSLGGVVLAMTLIATYGSVSSFVGGPGQAWNLGFGWLYYASIQIAAAYLVLGVLGKKIAIVGRRIDAITLPDLLRHRYQSTPLAIIAALVMILFFTTQMVAQFIGGAKLFEAATGYSYLTGLILFGIATVIYTSIGGFKAVAITDTICAILMVLGTLILAAAVLNAGGGFNQIMTTIETEAPGHFDPFAGGSVSPALLLSGWFLVGFCLVGLPQSAVRCLSYKDTRAMHRAMLYGTVALGVMVVGMHFIGVLARGVITDAMITDVDSIIPRLVMGTMPPLLAGLVICGPLAASMSTISSLLIAASSALVKDIYQTYQEREGKDVEYKTMARLSIGVTFVLGMIAFVLSITPPDLIVWINLFAFGGLQSAFVWVLLLGMFWKRANTQGALAGMIGGTVVYLGLSIAGISWFGMHNIVWGLFAGLVLFVGTSLFTPPMDDAIGRIYFPEKY